MKNIRKGATVELEKGIWTIGEQIGSGGFASIYRAGRNDGVNGVIKSVKKEKGADRELLFVDLADVEGVVPIIDSGETETTWLLAMPEADYSLRAYIESQGKLTDEQVRSILGEIAASLEVLGGRGVVHRDIKPENILYLNGRWCLADFGISRYAEATTAPDTQKFAMTPPYAAPEQWRFERASSATDIYALGVIAFEILAQTRPFLGPAFEQYREQHLHNKVPSLDMGNSALEALVTDCLSKSAGARPSAAVFSSRLSRASAKMSGGLGALQAAAAKDAERRADIERTKQIERTAAQVRDELAEAGRQIYGRIQAEIADAIESAAPGVDRRIISEELTLSLGAARLEISHKPYTTKKTNEPWQIPFDVVLHAAIDLNIPRDEFGFAGKANALWYCDAQVKGEYGWYELGFMVSPMMQKQFEKHPAGLAPGEPAAKALWRGMSEFQLAWPLTRLDPGNIDDFIDRWAGWFGSAATGSLSRPSRQPEVATPSNWRYDD